MPTDTDRPHPNTTTTPANGADAPNAVETEGGSNAQ